MDELFAFPTEYMLHCHNLEHEDDAMMANFEVVPGVPNPLDASTGS